MEIRSYRSVFDLERRIYSVDRLRLNPAGIPVRGVLYFFALLGSLLIARSLPILGRPLRELPWYLCDLALPAVAATVLGFVRLEGRPFHQAARVLLRHRLARRRLSGLKGASTVGRRWYPPDILLLPDGSDGLPRRLRYTGPGAMLIELEHERCNRYLHGRVRRLLRCGAGPDLLVRASCSRRPGGGEVIALAAGATLEIRPRGRG